MMASRTLATEGELDESACSFILSSQSSGTRVTGRLTAREGERLIIHPNKLFATESMVIDQWYGDTF